MPLSTATEFIAVTLIFNKLTGFYGVLALFTGYALSPTQISQYLLSLLILVALFCILPHIRKGTPFPNLAFAWLYVVETLFSIGYTVVFAIAWCLTTLEDQAVVPGATENAEDKYGASASNGEYEAATAAAAVAANNSDDQLAQYAATMAGRETATSLVLVALFSLVRIYFCFVVLAYARRTVRNYVHSQYASAPGGADDIDGDTTAAAEGGDMDKNIFAVGSQLGDGWRGKMGRAMVSVGKGYWLGRKEDEEWARNVGSKFGRSRAV